MNVQQAAMVLNDRGYCLYGVQLLVLKMQTATMSDIMVRPPMR
jgi:hypothetical protein